MSHSLSQVNRCDDDVDIGSTNLSVTTGRDSLPCLVVQMPSVDAMRRQVADITCQMQSVYLDDSQHNEVKQVTKMGKVGDSDSNNLVKQKPTYIESQATQGHDRLPGNANSASTGSSQCDDDSRGRSDLAQLFNHRKRELADQSPIQSTRMGDCFDTSSPDGRLTSSECLQPKNESISEEFVINGKRYRQTYQKRTVLERRVVRDVFFLPGRSNTDFLNSSTNSADCATLDSEVDQKNDSSPVNSSPMTRSPLKASSERPRLDLKVLTSSPNKAGLSPTVVMHPASPIKSSSSVKTANGLVRSKSSVSVASASTTNSESIEGTPVIVSDASSQKDNGRRKNAIEPRRRGFVQNLGEAIGRRLRSLSRPRSRTVELASNNQSDRGDQDSMGNGMEEGERQDELRSNNETDNKAISVKKDHIKAPETPESKRGSRAIVGYMYKFGAWDESAPVLDPRLPLATSSAFAPSPKSGLVIANPPEWHHAELGLGKPPIATDDEELSPTGQSQSLVRGRVVACLQRFTQHSATSGQELHRSTYVEQRRLLRKKLNKNGQASSIQPGSTIDELSKSDEQAFRDDVERIKPNSTSFTHASDANLSCLSTEEDEEGQMASSSAAPCSDERVGLLNSLCPSAAVAYNLLSKKLSSLNHQSDSESDDQLDDRKKGENVNQGDRIVVTAKTWCPANLLSLDPSPLLLATESEEDLASQLSSSSNHHQGGKSTTRDTSELTIRAGTQEGLLLFALLHSRDQTTDKIDSIFPNVYRRMYPAFTSIDWIVERLVQLYIAFAPVEPGCLAGADWTDSLHIATFLFDMIVDIPTSDMSVPLVLSLARFAQLLSIDARLASPSRDQDDPEVGWIDFNVANRLSALSERLMVKIPVPSIMDHVRRQKKSVNEVGKLNKSALKNGLEDNSRHIDDQQKAARSNGRHAATNGGRQIDQSTVTQDSMVLTSSCHGNVTTDVGCTIDPMMERTRLFMKQEPSDLAKEITRIEEKLFSSINFTELLDISSLERGSARSLADCVDQFNRLTRWARGLMLIRGPQLAKYEGEPANASPNQKQGSAKDDLVASKASSNSDANHNSDHINDKTDKLGASCSPVNFQRRSFRLRCIPIANGSNESNAQTPKLLRERQRLYVNLIFCKLCEVLKHLRLMKNFSSFLAILLAIQDVPEAILMHKSKQLMTTFSSYMKPPAFGEYRRDLENASLPYLPYLGLIFQQLIHLNAGNRLYLPVDRCEEGAAASSVNDNSAFLDVNTKTSHALIDAMVKPDSGQQLQQPYQYINVWRIWKHYMILGYFIKRLELDESGKTTDRHQMTVNPEIASFLCHPVDNFVESRLDEAKEELSQWARRRRSLKVKWP